MADEKKYTAQEAAIAVLKKAEEMLKASSLMKAEKEDENEIGTKFVKAENKAAPSNSQKPRIEEKPTERDYNDFETKPGHEKTEDHREATQTPPDSNPKEESEGNNADWGTSPQVKGHIKLAHFMGHAGAKKQNQKNNNTGTAMGKTAAQQLEKSDMSRGSGGKVIPGKMKKGIALS